MGEDNASLMKERNVSLSGMKVTLFVLVITVAALGAICIYNTIEMSHLNSEMKAMKQFVGELDQEHDITPEEQYEFDEEKRVKRDEEESSEELYVVQTNTKPRHRRRQYIHLLESVLNSTVGAHLAHVGYDYVNEILNPNGYLHWCGPNEDYSGLYLPDPSYIHENMSTIVIPENGLYEVYAQVTWEGKQQAEATQNRPHAKMSVVIRYPEVDDHELMASYTTQMNLGAQLMQDIYPTYPYDSAHVNGMFNLMAGQVIAVKVFSEGTQININKAATYFGFRQIHRVF